MSNDDHPVPHAGMTVHGGHVHIGNAAVGPNAIAIGVVRDQAGLVRTDDGTLVDPERLRRAVEDLAAAVRESAGPVSDRQDQWLAELQQAVAPPQPQRRRALEILGHFADSSAAGQVVFTALSAIAGALGAP